MTLTDKQILDQGKSLWPYPLTESQMSHFLKRNSKKSQYEKTLAWEKRKSEHQNYIHDRYGLSDAYPSKMADPDPLFDVEWSFSLNEYTILFTYIWEPKLTIRGWSDCPEAKIVQTIVAHCNKQDILAPKLYNLEPVGKLTIHGLPKPTHDWVEWRERISHKYGIKESVLNKLIRQYKVGQLKGAHCLDELEEEVQNEFTKSN